MSTFERFFVPGNDLLGPSTWGSIFLKGKAKKGFSSPSTSQTKAQSEYRNRLFPRFRGLHPFEPEKGTFLSDLPLSTTPFLESACILLHSPHTTYTMECLLTILSLFFKNFCLASANEEERKLPSSSHVSTHALLLAKILCSKSVEFHWHWSSHSKIYLSFCHELIFKI